MQHVARRSGRVPKSHNNATARRRRASANADGAGSRPSEKTTPTTTIINSVLGGHGFAAILATGANIVSHYGALADNDIVD